MPLQYGCHWNNDNYVSQLRCAAMRLLSNFKDQGAVGVLDFVLYCLVTCPCWLERVGMRKNGLHSTSRLSSYHRLQRTFSPVLRLLLCYSCQPCARELWDMFSICPIFEFVCITLAPDSQRRRISYMSIWNTSLLHTYHGSQVVYL